MDKQYTKDEWDKFGTMYTSLVKFAYEFMAKFCSKDETFMDVTIDDETQTINISTELYWGGDTDYNSYELPMSYLYTDGWQDLYQVLLDEQKRKEHAAKLEREKEKEERATTERRKQFLKLQEEFGTK